MKKLATLLLMSFFASGLMAQTNFRDIAFEDARKAAQSENKQILIDFFTDWCGPCKKMATEVFPQKPLGDYLNARFVCVKYNAEKEGKDLASTFGVAAFPTFIVADAFGKKLYDIVGFMPANDFIGKIEENANPEEHPDRIKARYEAGERTPRLVNRYVMILMRDGREKEGYEEISKYFEGLSDQQRLSAENVFIYTRFTQDWYDERCRWMVAHRDEFAPEIAEEISRRTDNLYHMAVTRYFSGYLRKAGQYEEAEYLALKQQVALLPENDRVKYTPVFKLIESRHTKDDSAFFDDVTEIYCQLDARYADLLVMNLSRLIETDDEELIRRQVDFIRENLPSMRPGTITMCGRLLDSLEGKLK
ncbi:MAG: thioredoxin family protein [Bacteroidales bacterium]|nr:thioredoxin family protein [Bacteroidales bacterium]